MADLQILATGVEAAPSDVVIPDSAEIQPKSVRATFDGSGATSPFLPTLVLVSDAGHEAWRVPTAIPVAAGDSAEVSWAPFLDGRPPGLPYWTNIFSQLSLNYGAFDNSQSYAFAMVQATAPSATVLVWLRLVLAGDYSPSSVPFQVLGLPPAWVEQRTADQSVTAVMAYGVSEPVGASDTSAPHPAFLDATGIIENGETGDPVVCADNYKLGAVIFSGFGVYPYDPGPGA